MRNLHGALLVAALAVTSLSADTLNLRDGRTLKGTFVSATSRQVRFMVDGGRTQVFPIPSVLNLRFGDASMGNSSGSGYGSGTYGNNDRSGTYRNDDRSGTYRNNDRAGAYGNGNREGAQGSDSRGGYRDDQYRSRNASANVPAGTVVTVRTIDAINSDKSNAGDTFRASLDEPLIVNGRTVAPKGADVSLRITKVDQSNGVTGTEEVTLELAQISVNGRAYNVRSSSAEVAAKNRGKESVKVIGGTAVLGAIIGAIAGGGKGAAIGAASGAGAGAAIQAIRGQRVQIPSESVLDFTLSEPLYVD